MRMISTQAKSRAGLIYGIQNLKDKVLLTSDAREVFHIALILDGKSPNTTNEEEIKAAYERLVKIVTKCGDF